MEKQEGHIPKTSVSFAPTKAFVKAYPEEVKAQNQKFMQPSWSKNFNDAEMLAQPFPKPPEMDVFATESEIEARKQDKPKAPPLVSPTALLPSHAESARIPPRARAGISQEQGVIILVAIVAVSFGAGYATARYFN